MNDDFKIIETINSLAESHIQKNVNSLKKILKANDEFYNINILLGRVGSFNPCQINGSHEDYIFFEINNFIKDIITFNKKIAKFSIFYNYHSEEIENTYEIHLIVEKIYQKDFLFFNTEEFFNKKHEKRIIKIIRENYEISHTDLIQKTRFIKSTDERKKILSKLEKEKIIKSKKVKEPKSKKIKRVYFI